MMGFTATFSINDIQHNEDQSLASLCLERCLVSYCYADNWYAEWRYAECRYDECRVTGEGVARAGLAHSTSSVTVEVFAV
jgi:hypothetical protein